MLPATEQMIYLFSMMEYFPNLRRVRINIAIVYENMSSDQPKPKIILSFRPNNGCRQVLNLNIVCGRVA